MSARLIDIEVDGRTHGVTVDRLEKDSDRFHVSWAGRTYVVDARAIDAHTLSLIDESGTLSQVVRFVEPPNRDDVGVHLSGVLVRAVVNRQRVQFGGPGGDGTTGDGALIVTAPMPGKVVRLLVEVGDQVEARQALVVVEAMKMENELTAQRAGRVADIQVDEGMSVETGKVLVVLE